MPYNVAIYRHFTFANRNLENTLLGRLEQNIYLRWCITEHNRMKLRALDAEIIHAFTQCQASSLSC